MCAQNPNAFGKPAGLDFVVQRQWSNKAAAAGHDPCVPTAAGEVYFNATPVLPDAVTLGGGGQKLTMQGVTIPVGEERTIEVELFSDAKTNGPWKVEALDANQLFGGKPTMSFKLDRNSGENGEKLHLTIKALAKGQYGASVFFLSSQLGNRQNFWLGLVSN